MCRKARSSILQPGAICNVPADIEVGDSKPMKNGLTTICYIIYTHSIYIYRHIPLHDRFP